jgi:hypothetical protein
MLILDPSRNRLSQQKSKPKKCRKCNFSTFISFYQSFWLDNFCVLKFLHILQRFWRQSQNFLLGGGLITIFYKLWIKVRTKWPKKKENSLINLLSALRSCHYSYFISESLSSPPSSQPASAAIQREKSVWGLLNMLRTDPRWWGQCTLLRCQQSPGEFRRSSHCKTVSLWF